MPHSLTNRWSSVSLLASAICFASWGCGGQPVAAPTSLTKFESKDKQVRFEYPAGWEVTASGGQGLLSHSVFQQGPAKIDVGCDLAGSLFAGPGAPRDPNEEPASARIHELGLKNMKEDFSGYEEQPAQPIKTNIGEGRISEFTAAGSFGGKIRGYRATALTRDRRVTVICTCPERDWETLKPAFTKVIGSLSQGSGR